jgi:hypothetical protein
MHSWPGRSSSHNLIRHPDMWNPNPPYIYFASNSLACVRDTRALTLAHGLIWRPLNRNLYRLQPGDRLLLAFWLRQLRRFVPLARLRTRALDANLGEQPCAGGPCYCIIPNPIRHPFLTAHQGENGGRGYTAIDNPQFTAVCVEKLKRNDPVDQIWQGLGHGPHDLPPIQHRYGWANLPRPAMRHFDVQQLAAPLLPQSMHP